MPTKQDNLEKEISKIIRKNYAIGGSIEGYQGLLFTYENLDLKEREMISFIRLRESRLKESWKKEVEEIQKQAGKVRIWGCESVILLLEELKKSHRDNPII